MIMNVWRGFVANRRVTVSSVLGSHRAAGATEWVVREAGKVKSMPWIGGSNGTALCPTERGEGGRLGMTVVWCMERHKAMEAVLRWWRLVPSWATLAMKTVVDGGSKRVAKERASAEGIMTRGVMHKRGFWTGSRRAMDRIPGSIESQVVYRLARG